MWWWIALGCTDPVQSVAQLGRAVTDRHDAAALEALGGDARIAWWLASTTTGDREIDCEEPVRWPIDHPRVCIDLELQSLPGRFPSDDHCLGGIAQIDGHLVPLKDVGTIDAVHATVDLDLDSGEISGSAKLTAVAPDGVVAFSGCSDSWGDCEVSTVELDGVAVPFAGRFHRYVAAVPPSDAPIELEVTWSGELSSPSVIRPELVLLYSMNAWLPGSLDGDAPVDHSVWVRGGDSLQWRGPGVSHAEDGVRYRGSTNFDLAGRPEWIEEVVDIDGVTFDIGVAPESADRLQNLVTGLQPALRVATEIGPVPSTILVTETLSGPATSGTGHLMLPLDDVLVKRPWVLAHEMAHQSFAIGALWSGDTPGLGEQLTNAISLRAEPQIAESVRHYWRQVVSESLKDPHDVRGLLDSAVMGHEARYERGGLLGVALEHWIGPEAFTTLVQGLAARPYADWATVVDAIDDPEVAERVDGWVRMEALPALDLSWTETGIRLSDTANSGVVGPLLLQPEGPEGESLPPITVALEDLPVEVPMPAEVRQIEADPEAWLLLRVPPGEERLVWTR